MSKLLGFNTNTSLENLHYTVTALACRYYTVLTLESSGESSSLPGSDVGGGENSGAAAGSGVLPRVTGLCNPRLVTIIIVAM